MAHTNEEITELIQQGNSELLPLLWENVRGILQIMCKRYYNTHRELLQRFGYEFEDLQQESYNAVLYAANGFDSSKGYKFTTYLKYAFQRITSDMLNNKSDALNTYGTTSFEQPIGFDDEGNELTLSDITEDSSAAIFDSIDRSDEFDILHIAVNSLPEQEQTVIKLHYYSGKTFRECGELLGVSKQRAMQIERNALNMLRRGKTGRILRAVYGDEYGGLDSGVRRVSTYRYRNTRLSECEIYAFRHLHTLSERR